MSTAQKRSLLQPVDLIADREYILAELEKSEKEGVFISLKESYNQNMKKLDELAKSYERV